MKTYAIFVVLILAQLPAHSDEEKQRTDSEIPQKGSEITGNSTEARIPNEIKIIEWLHEQGYSLTKWKRPTEGIHPVKNLSLHEIRSAILSAINKYEFLRDLFDGEAITNSMPYYFDCWYPEPWPLFRVSHMTYNPFATIGRWHIYFGRRPNESIIDPVRAEIPQCIVYKWLEYFDQEKELVKVRKLIIDIRPDERENRSSQTTNKIQARGWYIQEYIAEDKGTHLFASSVKYTHGGGIYSKLHRFEKGEFSTAIFDIAFRGVVLRCLGDSKGR